MMKKCNIKAMSISTVLTIILIVIMTIASELSKPFKDFLAGLFSHHWVAKSIIAIIFFIVVYFILSKTKEEKDTYKQTKLVFITTILGGAAIFIFYLWHFFSG